MNRSEDIIVSAIKAVGAAITSPYPYYGLLAILEYFAFSSFLAKQNASSWDFAGFCIATIFLSSAGLLVSRLIEKVGHEKMLSSEVLVKLAEIDAKLKLSQNAADKRKIS